METIQVMKIIKHIFVTIVGIIFVQYAYTATSSNSEKITIQIARNA